MDLDLDLDLDLDPDTDLPDWPRLVPRPASKNPISYIYWFRGSLVGIRYSEFEPSKDWIAPPSPSQKCTKSIPRNGL